MSLLVFLILILALFIFILILINKGRYFIFDNITHLLPKPIFGFKIVYCLFLLEKLITEKIFYLELLLNSSRTTN